MRVREGDTRESLVITGDLFDKRKRGGRLRCTRRSGWRVMEQVTSQPGWANECKRLISSTILWTAFDKQKAQL